MTNNFDEVSEGFPKEGKPNLMTTLNRPSVNLIIDDFKKLKEEIDILQAKIISTSCASIHQHGSSLTSKNSL